MKVAILIADPIKQALKQTMELFGEIEFVDDAYEANIVVGQNPKELAPFYCQEREFIIFSDNKHEKHQEAKNVHAFGVMEAMEIMTMPALRAQKPLPVLPTRPEILSPSERRINNPGAVRVLVIDDTVMHQKSALSLLVDCDLTVAIDYDEAMGLLESNQYDAVLTDMEMPSSTKLSCYQLGKMIPYGLLIATEAARVGAKHVAIVTNLNHHTDPFAAAFDHFSHHDYIINGAVVKYMHAPMININGEYVKNWKSALQELLK
jgi:CheY-like chemotaxis protein